MCFLYIYIMQDRKSTYHITVEILYKKGISLTILKDAIDNLWDLWDTHSVRGKKTKVMATVSCKFGYFARFYLTV